MELSSPYPKTFIPDIPLWEYLHEKIKSVLQKGDKKFLTDLTTDSSICYSELEPISRRVASGLYRRGFRAGDTLLYSTRNCCHIYPIVLGVWRVNGIARTSYVEDLADAHHNRMVESECRFIICDSETAPEIQVAIQSLKWKPQVFAFGDVDSCLPVSVLLQDDGKAFPEHIVVKPREDPVFIPATSGTTGFSKGAVHTHRSIIAMLVQKGTGVPTYGRVLILFRPVHIGGVLWPLYSLQNGDQVFTMQDFDEETLFAAVQNQRVDTVSSVPHYLTWLVKNSKVSGYDFSSLRQFFTAGSDFPIALEEDMKKKWPNFKYVHKAYGMTEIFIVVSTTNFPENILAKVPVGTVGQLAPFAKCRVEDTDTGEILGPNKIGELCFQTDLCMVEYLKRPDENKKFFRNSWTHTGDLGFYDDDGFFFICGRAKDVFKRFSNHVSPSELENILLSHPEILEAAVIGVMDKEGEEEPKAFVVRQPEARVTEEQVKAFVSERVAPYKQLTGGVIFLEAIPKTKTGKISTLELRKM